MAVTAYQIIYNCTPAQFATAMNTTLPAAGFTVMQFPIKFTGVIQGNTGGSAGLGQIDFSYDGQYFLKFFGANPAPIGQQPQTGIPASMLTTALTIYLNTTLRATLGEPIPSNIANVPGPAA